MKKYSSEKGASEDLSEICITPLADLALCMLITLMLISPMMIQSMIKISSSSAVARTVKERVDEKPLYIDITTSGYLLNNNKMKSEEDLFLNLRGELSRKSDKTVLITAQDTIKHGVVVKVLDLSKQAGASTLSILKRKKV